MHIIDKIDIKNLWGTNNLIISCFQDYNFLIGENGTGKTTVINLVAAALRADFKKLDQIEFESIEISLKTNSSRKKPSIKVMKSKKKDLPFSDITYEIKQSQSEDPEIFDLDELESERIYRGFSVRMLREMKYNHYSSSVYNAIEKLVNVNWLSVHRNDEIYNKENDNRPPIDVKVDNLNDSLVKFFSSLSKKFSEKIIDFQKEILLSILTPETEDKILKFGNDINVDKEKKALEAIFEVLGVKEVKIKAKIQQHFDRFNKANEYLHDPTNSAITPKHFASLLNVWRSHALVVEYEALQDIKHEIFSQQNKFIDLLNQLFEKKKTVKLSDRNELVFYTSNTLRELKLNELSSGEKQLLIILGQALLQEQKQTIYIADEPELSLHLKWQTSLTNAITTLNPKAQIIFATHSPDIVAAQQNKVIRMENIL